MTFLSHARLAILTVCVTYCLCVTYILYNASMLMAGPIRYTWLSQFACKLLITSRNRHENKLYGRLKKTKFQQKQVFAKLIPNYLAVTCTLAQR